ncbi:2EXR domain-containing protein [Fusarium acuminatum]|uniref:2EXR domain-containing protein n=1 Tax=Fusarium acuminatum TaxID=5515 RepID=A0ABZ2XDQ0_9HYPO
MEDESSILTTTLWSDAHRGPLSSKGDKACQPPHISADVSARQPSPPQDTEIHLYEFKYFAKLPAEVRREIWNLAFSPSSPRIYIPYARQIEGSGRQYPHYRHDLPGLMVLYKEVREITTRNRELSLISGRYDVCTFKHVDRIYGWVDPKRDLLYIDLNRDIQGHFDYIGNVFETVILCPKYIGNAFHLEELSRWSTSLSHFCSSESGPSYSSKVKELQLVCRSYNLPISRFSVGTQNDFLVLDLDKENDVNWFLTLRSRFPKCDIPWNVIENDFRRERNLDWQLGLLNDWSAGVKRFKGQYHIRLGDADSENMRHLPLPTDVQVDVLDIVNDTWVDPDGISDNFHGYFWFMLPWAEYKTLVSQVWASSIGVETFPKVRRVVQFHLES